ncbi:MAG: hypothetical protein H6714_02035 [Myxococcales bacterium]|nr:hypothetical protein [Myxococcales bacterium]
MTGMVHRKNLSLLAFLAMTLLACTEKSSLIAGDGIAPYRETSGVELCLDRKQLMPSSELKDGPWGLCTPDVAIPASCRTSRECRSREACLCGQCVLQLCQTSSECGPSQFCAGSPLRCTRRCSGPSDCLEREICQQGACLPSCGNAKDCAYGELCLVGRCIALGCNAGSTVCGVEESCALQRQAADLSSPAAHFFHATTVLYVIVTVPDGAMGVYRGVAPDQTHFSLEPVLGLELDPASAPSRLGLEPTLQDGVWVYHAIRDRTEIVRSWAIDGKHFESEEPVLAALDDWEHGHIYSPAVLNIEGQTWLFYVAGDSAQIGAAVQEEDGGFRRLSNNPVLTAPLIEQHIYQGLWQHLTDVTDPWPVEYQNAFGRHELRLYFAALGQERLGDSFSSLGSRNFSIGMARWTLNTAYGESKFAFHSFPYNPIFARRRNLAELEEREPTVLLTPAGGIMYFSERGRILLAVNSGVQATLD